MCLYEIIYKQTIHLILCNILHFDPGLESRIVCSLNLCESILLSYIF
jgi:hypothetical protein